MEDKRLIDDKSVSLKELVLRIESTMNSRLDSLQQTINSFQLSSVQKAEYEEYKKTVDREILRIEGQCKDNFREFKDDTRNSINELESDIKASTQRLIIAAGFLLALIDFALKNLK